MNQYLNNDDKPYDTQNFSFESLFQFCIVSSIISLIVFIFSFFLPNVFLFTFMDIEVGNSLLTFIFYLTLASWIVLSTYPIFKSKS